MPCPFLKNGVCTSPALKSPSDHVVDSVRCTQGYTTCRLYNSSVPASSKNAVENGTATIPFATEVVTLYPAVNVMGEREVVASGCEYYMLVRTSKGVVAWCDVLTRVITKLQALKCSKNYETCPFRAVGIPRRKKAS